MKLKNVLSALITIALLFAILFIPLIFACEHEVTYSSVVLPATCTEAGEECIVCGECGFILKNIQVKPLGHSFGEYRLISAPRENASGVESSVCSNCQTERVKEVVCSHVGVYPLTEKEATCSEEGILYNFCKSCGSIVSEEIIDKKECTYGDWVYVEYATPMESGDRYRKCSQCGDIRAEKYGMTMAGRNSIYIPGTGINDIVSICELTQENVDVYDLVCDFDFFNSSGVFILGHKTGTMAKLCETMVGQHIYVSIGGEIKVYKVIISEYGIQNNSWTDIVGQVSGISVLHSFDEETLHMYTCYGEERNGRWIVLATLV